VALNVIKTTPLPETVNIPSEGNQRAVENRDSNSLVLLEIDGYQVVLPKMSSIIIGRINHDKAGQDVPPDVDLSPFGAYDKGVSRRHAEIKCDGKVSITDLNSSNGTYVNGQRIIGNSFALRHGDELRLGRLKLKIRF